MKVNPIKYQITESDRGVCLQIWEAADPNSSHSKPYRFIANYSLKNAFEAEAILRQYYRVSYEDS
jgi:hypothetical protein